MEVKITSNKRQLNVMLFLIRRTMPTPWQFLSNLLLSNPTTDRSEIERLLSLTLSFKYNSTIHITVGL